MNEKFIQYLQELLKEEQRYHFNIYATRKEIEELITILKMVFRENEQTDQGYPV